MVVEKRVASVKVMRPETETRLIITTHAAVRAGDGAPRDPILNQTNNPPPKKLVKKIKITETKLFECNCPAPQVMVHHVIQNYIKLITHPPKKLVPNQNHRNQTIRMQPPGPQVMVHQVIQNKIKLITRPPEKVVLNKIHRNHARMQLP